ncbi:MAG: hypothetical protein LUP94_01715 [Candidatus Methanomethylicus sp.]|nr:hypothetical protein [Candidatus Methanomethylicus sp.]
MSDLLRSGATMLSQTCPDCKVPLFKLPSGEIICPSCNRRAVFTSSNEVEKVKVEAETTNELDDVILEKTRRLKSLMAKTDNPEQLEKLAKTLIILYDLLDRVRRTKI